jgi:hypothetical protein
MTEISDDLVEELGEDIAEMCRLKTPVPDPDFGPPPDSFDPKIMLMAPLLTLVLIAALGVLSFRYIDLFFTTAVTIILLTPLLWLLASSLRSAMPERDCPECEQARLVLLDPQKESGVRCLDCSFQDPELRLPYMKNLMNDPEIAREAGYVIDDYGDAHLPESMVQGHE